MRAFRSRRMLASSTQFSQKLDNNIFVISYRFEEEEDKHRNQIKARRSPSLKLSTISNYERFQ